MNSAVTSHQTLRYLLKRFEEVGIQPKTHFGQNFLIDLNLLHVLVDAAGLESADVVLEVGGGTGSLTSQLATRAGQVICVEIDRQLAQLHREALADFSNVTLLVTDALRNKHRLQPEVMDAVGAAMAAGTNRTFKLVANLPYHIATPLISNLLASELPPARMVVTIQKEVADRLVSAPRTKDYGALSVWVQSQCRVEILRVMPPAVFWPRPKVDSAIVRIDLDPSRRAAIPHLAYFHDFTRALFFHRRKFLRSVLTSAFKQHLDKAAVDEVLSTTGIEGTIRAEELAVEQILPLCEAFRLRAPEMKL